MNLDETETRIGNNDRSDFEFYQQIKKAEKKLDDLNNASTSDNLLDAVNTTVGSKNNDNESKTDNYIFDKITTADYTDLHNKNNTDMDNEQIKESKEDIGVNENLDSTNDNETVDDFNDNENDILENEANNDTVDDFEENTSDVTESIDESKDSPDKLNNDFNPPNTY